MPVRQEAVPEYSGIPLDNQRQEYFYVPGSARDRTCGNNLRICGRPGMSELR